MYKRQLHAFAETVDLKPFVWHAQPHDDVPHDFRVSNLRQTPWMHARMDADYNGWWFCLIPTEIVRAVGLALPEITSPEAWREHFTD